MSRVASIAHKLQHGMRRRLSRLLPSAYVIKRQYFKTNGFYPDLKNPKGLSEKLCWMKLNYLTPLQVQCCDKLDVRSYVTETIGSEYLIPICFEADRVEDLHPDAFECEKFAIKATHDSGGVVLCHDRGSFDWLAARKFLTNRMRQNYFWETREPVYNGVTPRIIVEEMLPSSPDAPLVDFKMHCVGGKFQFTMVVLESKELGTQRIFYDRDWNKLEIRGEHPVSHLTVPRPEPLEKMIELAEKLAQPFPMCRVDLYCIINQIYFGEITFYPWGGHVCMKPDAEERRLGDLLPLPEAVDIKAVLRQL